MKVFVGTSGWMYSWNVYGNLDWYIENSKLNAVELNASFYRFPFKNQVKGWSRKGRHLRWSIKVNRFITHRFRMNERGKESFYRFLELFKPMEEIIDFYLFQLPPSFGPDKEKRLLDFFEGFDKGKIVVEFRNKEWFKMDLEEWGRKNNLLVCSIDSPDFEKLIFNVNGKLYLRFHGRGNWYSYDYSMEELKEVKDLILSKNPEKIYAFFNNNHSMLNNAQTFLGLFNT
ncbi:MAG: DUF72 domain-containing protein [Caldiserica bacterium]|nr:MAG: DUF72 domain-containing protein [Caldisericota bacterium]